MANRPERGIKMTLCQALLDDRIDDNTIVIIKDVTGCPEVVIISDMTSTPIACGHRYKDKILAWGSSEVSFDFVEERNIAILQLL